MASLYAKLIKRILDFTLALAGLLILLPFLFALAIAIKLDSPGPVLFKQKRIKRGKATFNMLKLRTMRADAPKDTPTHLLVNPDMYISRVGRLLRKFSLDEIVQLIHIIGGSMSIIGPRPALWNQDDLIAERDKYGANDVKPGLTGWAQINGRDELPIDVKARLDGEYAQNVTFLMDCKCFFGTIKSVLGQKGVVEGGTGSLEPKNEVCVDMKTQKTMNHDNTLKNVLIIGKNSYIGSSFANYAESQFNITIVGARNDQWKEVDFSGYGSVLHCAGIAHVPQKKSMKGLYYSVNCDLAVEVAKRAKESGVKQFVFLSSMSVYGKSDTVITMETTPRPESFYGDSKFRAELMIQSLSDSNFKVCIIRPPMVYGFGCKGNFPKLVWLAKKLPIFPDVNNRRSMIYINNLCSYISNLIESNGEGIHLPQNKEYVNTTLLVRTIAKLHGKKIYTTKLLNPLVFLFAKFISPINKLFGDLSYVYLENRDEHNGIEFGKSIRDALFGEIPVKITVVTSYFKPEITTISNLYENIVFDLAEYGAEVTLVTGVPTRLVDVAAIKEYKKKPIEQINERVKIIRTGPTRGEGANLIFRALYHLFRSYCIYKKARKIATDVYFINSTPPHMGFFGALLAKRANVIYDLQNIFPDTLIHSGKAKNSSILIKFFRKVETFVYKKCTHFRVVSKDMKDTLKERGVEENKISLIYNWVDENKVVYIDKQSNPLFYNFQLPKDKFYVCYAGNIGLIQNLSTMIQAAECLQNSHPEIIFIIIGDGAWKSEMLKLIDTKSLRNIKVFPMQSSGLIPFVYNIGDIGVVTVAKDVTKGSMPSKTWNILSASRPIICEVDEASELASIITTNECGICVAPGNHSSFVDAVLELYGNSTRLKKLGENGRLYVENHLSRKILTRKVFCCAMRIVTPSF